MRGVCTGWNVINDLVTSVTRTRQSRGHEAKTTDYDAKMCTEMNVRYKKKKKTSKMRQTTYDWMKKKTLIYPPQCLKRKG